MGHSPPLCILRKSTWIASAGTRTSNYVVLVLVIKLRAIRVWMHFDLLAHALSFDVPVLVYLPVKETTVCELRMSECRNYVNGHSCTRVSIHVENVDNASVLCSFTGSLC